jgi:hypothetical protein
VNSKSEDEHTLPGQYHRQSGRLVTLTTETRSDVEHCMGEPTVWQFPHSLTNVTAPDAV